jgi:hypothetical protein
MRTARARLTRKLGTHTAQLTVDNIPWTLTKADVVALAEDLQRVLASYAREAARTCATRPDASPERSVR